MKKSQKGIVAPLVLSITLVLILLGYLTFVYVTKTEEIRFSSSDEISIEPTTSLTTSSAKEVTVAEAEDGYLRYSNSKYGIEFEYPSKYVFSENTSMSSNFVYLVSFCLNRDYRESCFSPFDDFSLIVATKDWYDNLLATGAESNEQITVNGMPAITRKIIPTHLGDETLVFIEHGNTFIIFSALGDTSDFERVLSTLELNE